MGSLFATCVVGTRPNFVKMAALLEAARGRPGIRTRLVHTGQHFSPEMSQAFFEELRLPEPDVYLGVSGGSHAEQTAEIMKRLDGEFTGHRPGAVIVVGDVNSTLAAALVASKMGIPVAHVEAGLRSFDRRMPEEINRVVTDALSEWLFVSERSGIENLLKEGIPRERMFFAGNTMIDTLLRFREAAARSKALERLGLAPKSYAAVTLHRPSNVDEPAQLRRLLEVLEALSQRLPVVFPAHPRTVQRIGSLGIQLNGPRLIAPLGYLDFLKLQSEARLVLTDSGGVQEETTILGVPCLTLRENTERPVTIEAGTNRLAGVEPGEILRAATEVLENPPAPRPVPELWDGRAADRVLDVLESGRASPDR